MLIKFSELILNLYVLVRAGSFSRHTIDMRSQCGYYDLYGYICCPLLLKMNGPSFTINGWLRTMNEMRLGGKVVASRPSEASIHHIWLFGGSQATTSDELFLLQVGILQKTVPSFGRTGSCVRDGSTGRSGSTGRAGNTGNTVIIGRKRAAAALTMSNSKQIFFSRSDISWC